MSVTRLILAFALVTAAHAQFVPGPKLTAKDAVGPSGVGSGVAVSGDGNTAVVGGPGDNNGVGAVWVFVRTNGVWIQQGSKLVGTGAVGSAQQGQAVAISADGNTAIWGGGEDNNRAGAMWVFVRSNGVWSQQGPKLVGVGAAGNAHQGLSLAISADGNTAIVGGPGDSNYAGAAWVYTRANGLWSQQGPKLVGTGAAGINDLQGYGVGLSGDGNTAFVGGPNDNGEAGAVWVYNRTNGVWSQQGSKLTAADAVGKAALGASVAASFDGNTAVVGGWNDNNGAGATWVYTRVNGVWSQQGSKLVGTDADANAIQGLSVALSADGNSALVGGPIGSTGAAWEFGRTNGVWSQRGAKLIGPGAVGNASQGASVALSADQSTAIVGGTSDNGVGAAWVFTRPPPVRLIVAAPSSAAVGVPFTITVTAFDASGPPALNYSGIVHFSSSDPSAILPPDSRLSNGVGSFSATIRGLGFFTITATDTANQLITGTSNLIGTTTPAVHFDVQPYSTLVPVAGVPFVFLLRAFDQSGNYLQSYQGRVRFSSSDQTAILPGEMLVFGSSPFSAVLNAAGNQTITAIDTGDNSITGTSGPIPVAGTTSSNLARGKTATQSSTLPGYATGGAAAAVDGNTDGNFFDGSVTHTNLETNSWWQVDLGASSIVTSIVIWNRTDTYCITRLNDFWVFVSDTPFGATDTPSALQARAGTWSSHQTKAPSPSTTIAANTHGRYVRVQLAGANYLSLAEVQVLSNPAPDWNVARGRPATQSSTLPGYANGGAGAAVDGNTDGNFFNGSVTHTNRDANPWWQVDLGEAVEPESVIIYNRTDCCGMRLNDYYVFMSPNPFGPTDTILTLLYRQDTLALRQTAAPDPATAIWLPPVPTRYLRVHSLGVDYLSLAEVQVSANRNLARGAVATQSSALPGYANGGAGAAVDGNTDGNFSDGSVTHTNRDANAWWQVDLGASATISGVYIWGRTDCCASRLSDYWVFVSDTPFAASDTPSTLKNRPGSGHMLRTPAPSDFLGFGPGYHARYVRVQLSGTDYLSLAEVQVLGKFDAPTSTANAAYTSGAATSAAIAAAAGRGK